MADFGKSFGSQENLPCPTNLHLEGYRRVGALYLEVNHNKRDELIIWGAGYAIHKHILEEFEKEGFTGYRTKPALVRFRDGSTSTEYCEFIVTGWAGMASSESGIHEVARCPACHRKEYSAITDYRRIVDWKHWTGEDFFIVWPLAGYDLCTERVAHWLRARKVKSFRLEKELEQRERDPFMSKQGFTVSRLSFVLPEDLAIKYGRPLGLE